MIRSPNVRRFVVLALLGGLALVGCKRASDTSAGHVPDKVSDSLSDQAPEPTPVEFDHHVHLLSSGLVHDWKSLGVPFSKSDSSYTSASSVLAPLAGPAEEADGVKQAILIPMAHLYGQEEFHKALGLSEATEYERVRRENDHVALEAARFPARAVAFCSIDFLRPYAWEEIDRCRRDLGSPGVKLHLASAGTDLRDPDHLQALAQIAAWAEAERVVLMLHFDPQQRGLEVEDVERFISVVLEPYPELVVLVPHLGGSGGYGPWTQSVFGAFTRWLEAEAAAGDVRPGVYFDISGVWLEAESDGVPPSTDEEAAALRSSLLRMGLGRVVFGSDYPVFAPQDYAEALQDALELDPADWADLMQNRVPLATSSTGPVP